MRTIGFIGLGSMGKPMAANLLRAGYQVTTTYHRRKAPAEELGELGAAIVDSAAEVARASDVVITILPADREIMEVYTSEAGLLNHLREHSVCIEMTSATADTVRDIARLAADRGIQVLDAPVSGGIPAAVQGTLTAMVGGERSVYESCRPILEAMAANLFYTGGVGSGKAMKMINQMLNAGNTYVAAEAIYLARRMNVDLTSLSEVVQKSSGNSFVFQNAVQKFMIPGTFENGFTLALMTKDLGLSIEQASELGVSLPVMEAVYRRYLEVSDRGKGDRHYAIVSEWIAEHNRQGGRE